jgi:hypothetical protein
MNIAMATLYTKNIEQYALLSLENKKTYCLKHGYELLFSDKSLDDKRPPAWSKILLVKEHLKRFDWIFWSDIDALILNMRIKLSDFVDENFDFVAAVGKISPKINTGATISHRING